jgi:hypothetical protein
MASIVFTATIVGICVIAEGFMFYCLHGLIQDFRGRPTKLQ